VPPYLAPGIYVEEVSTGARPIQAVGTSTAGFAGEAPNPTAHLDEAFAVNNWGQFQREYVREGDVSTPLSNAVYAFFRNGGARCYVVNVSKDQSIEGDGRSTLGLRRLEAIDEVAIIAAPGRSDVATYEALKGQAERLWDRIAIADAPETFASVNQLTEVATVPVPETRGRRREGDGAEAAVTPPGENQGLRPSNSAHGFVAFYAPWYYMKDPLDAKSLVAVPPSGAMAGIYARTDATRGVHKAPANEMVRDALNLTYRFTRAEQETLNPKGVNCIRFFRDRGIVVYGARTLADDPEWVYVNVRRLFSMVEESIGQSTRWVVFEPNDERLWKAIRRDVGAFLRILWRDGALQGRTPEEAFFVKCDEETNPQEMIDAGIVVTLIGLAPVKPAEFVVFRIGQRPGGTEVQGEGGAGG
jgi:Bacteriophage tail sheath protein